MEEICANCGHAKSLHPPWCTNPYIPGKCNFQYDLCGCREFKSKDEIKFEPNSRLGLASRGLAFALVEQVGGVDWRERDVTKLQEALYEYGVKIAEKAK